MMIIQKLLEKYIELLPSVQKVYVVPLINMKLKESDYMYLLYKDIIEHKIESPVKIESLSVFSHPKFFFKRIAGEKNILHYNWLEVTDVKSLSGIFWKLFWITAYKMIGGKIIWTVHNKLPHNRTFIKLNIYTQKYMAALSDQLHVHCNSAVNIMSRELNADRNKFFIIEHPVYPAVIIDKSEAVRLLCEKYNIQLRNNVPIFLVFGQIARYKGIKEIVEIFKNEFLHNYLIVAGVIKKGNEEYFIKMKNMVSGSKNIFLFGELIPNEDMLLFYNSADYVLFNYDDILTSGGVMTALSFNKKIIAPSIGCISDIKDSNVYLFEKEEGGSNNLKKTLMSLNY